ncbi:putative 60S ribosomal protein L17 [Blattamonas nauphoetae]|uniref:60S ribosomal protein L17 n=1 Tax=Blattamonas nauphoetae TaxID=2049346 RepID=A0ABQ9YLK0_9EUKA|nr:putative 60S ribosomal protein L17 [Blattamonas nauphoetae]
MKGQYTNYTHRTGKIGKARADDVSIHFKQAVEIASTIRGMPVKRAKQFLVNVMHQKEAVPFRRYRYGIGRNAQGKAWKWAQSGFPKKASKYMLDLIRTAENSARQQNVNVKKCTIDHVKVNEARVRSRRTYRAHGRINHFDKHPCHIEIILKEREIAVPKAAEKKE